MKHKNSFSSYWIGILLCISLFACEPNESVDITQIKESKAIIVSFCHDISGSTSTNQFERLDEPLLSSLKQFMEQRNGKDIITLSFIKDKGDELLLKYKPLIYTMPPEANQSEVNSWHNEPDTTHSAMANKVKLHNQQKWAGFVKGMNDVLIKGKSQKTDFAGAVNRSLTFLSEPTFSKNKASKFLIIASDFKVNCKLPIRIPNDIMCLAIGSSDMRQVEKTIKGNIHLFESIESAIMFITESSKTR